MYIFLPNVDKTFILKVILGYLRTGKLVTSDLSDGMLRKLKTEAEFFNLQGLKDQVGNS